MLLLFPLLEYSTFNVLLILEPFLLLVTSKEIAESCKSNLLFLRNSLNSSLNEINNNWCSEVRSLENLEGLLDASFNPADRKVGDRLGRSS